MRLFFILLVILQGSLVEAATYYTDKSGSNANSCATAATAASDRTKAKLTLGSTGGGGGVGCLTTAGDTLIVGDGTYTEAQVNFGTSGTSGSRITMRAEHQWLAILSSTSSCNPNISVNAGYISIEDMKLVIDAANVYCTPNSAAGTGVRCWAGSSACYVRGIYVDDPLDAGRKVRSHGVKSNQDDCLVENNTLISGTEIMGNNCIVRSNTISGGGEWKSGIVVKGGVSGVEIYNNTIDTTDTGQINDWGIVLGGNTGGVTTECTNCLAHHNLVRLSTGIKALGFYDAVNSNFYNNTVIGGDYASTSAGAPGNSGNSWQNNIFSCGGGNPNGGTSGTHTIDYNDFYNCTSPPSQTHNFTSDPQFVGADDFHLQGGSPVIDVGLNVGLSYNGSAPDLGGFESGADTTPPAVPTGITIVRR